MTDPTWPGEGAPLPDARVMLLEASAGTGKTWQIASLVSRFVAEEGVPIEELLVITFTRAATAELRDRVRRRLADDRGKAEAGSERHRRLTRALAGFDRAAISTIHGFCQRMLDELAFESGQEPQLELLEDARPVLDERVADALADAYARADVTDVALLHDMGFTRAGLTKVAEAMAGPVGPVVDPPDGEADPLAAVAAWRGEVAAFLAAWRGEEAVEAVVATAQDKRVNGRQYSRKAVERGAGEVGEWLRAGATRRERMGAERFKYFTRAHLEAAWNGVGALEDFPAWPLCERFDALLAAQDRLWPRPVAGFARRVRDGLEDELVRRGLLTYDAILSRLAERIARPGVGEALAAAIRARYRVALVDEFQDTDGAQWAILHAAFGVAPPGDDPGDRRRLALIGDPKQAIYRFRGADVHVYMDAKREADARFTMDTNWRSDEGFVEAMTALWAPGSRAFRLDAFDYVPVCAKHAEKADGPRVRGLPEVAGRPRAPLELRWADGETLGEAAIGVTSKDAAEAALADLCAAEVARLLDAGAERRVDGRWRRLAPGDVAVLVRTNDQAALIKRRLARYAVPAVTAGRGSVFQSPAAEWLGAWLAAVGEPGRPAPARRLAVTPAIGWSARQLAEALARDEEAAEGEATAWAAWVERVARWAGLWESRGFVGAFDAAADDEGVYPRVLALPDGERLATDLRHLVELLHQEERRHRLGPLALAQWLEARADEAAAEVAGAGEEQALRLESDAAAVQVVTIHKSKGLEYPVVLAPFLPLVRGSTGGAGPLVWHDEGAGGHPVLKLDLHVDGSDARRRAAEVAGAEAEQEEMRLLYVCLTRAVHHGVAWIGPLGTKALDLDAQPLASLALRPRAADGTPQGATCGLSFAAPGKPKAGEPEPPSPEAVRDLAWARLDALAAASGGRIGWSHEAPAGAPWRVDLARGEARELAAAPWPAGRRLAGGWMVASYTSMVKGRTWDEAAEHRPDLVTSEAVGLAPAGLEAEAAPPDDGPGEEAAPEEAPDEAAAGPEPHEHLSALAGGADAGTWVHDVLEALDFPTCAGRDGRAAEEVAAELGRRRGVRRAEDHRLLAEGLPAVLDTPLDGALGLPEGFALRRLAAADRVDELAFDLRLGGGDAWRAGGARVDAAAARAALAPRAADGGWDGAGWLRHVLARTRDDGGPAPALPEIAGILTGFIDLVFRVPGPGGGGPREARYFVADYKTNRIGPPGRRFASRPRHFTRAGMAAEMAHHGYHLQALLYTVALHRWLRQRLGAAYDYDRHVGGHLYLFLRGMTGPDAPREGGVAQGVYADRWPREVVEGLSAALDGGGGAP